MWRSGYMRVIHMDAFEMEKIYNSFDNNNK